MMKNLYIIPPIFVLFYFPFIHHKIFFFQTYPFSKLENSFVFDNFVVKHSDRTRTKREEETRIHQFSFFSYLSRGVYVLLVMDDVELSRQIDSF